MIFVFIFDLFDIFFILYLCVEIKILIKIRISLIVLIFKDIERFRLYRIKFIIKFQKSKIHLKKK